MRVRLSASALWRFPEAKAMQTESGWVVEMGEAHEAVLPLGVDLAPGSFIKSERLDVSLHDIHERLREVALYDGEEAARRLERHCRLYPPPLLCVVHGLASGHSVDCSDMSIPGDPQLRLKVDHIIALVTGLDGVRALAYYLATQRKPARRALVENALAWPILAESFGPGVRRTLRADGVLGIELAREVVTRTITAALQVCTSLRSEWLPNEQPSLAFKADTALGAYVVDFVQHVGADSNVDRSVTCVVCGLPYRPRRAPQPGAAYCAELECQRERRRINKARQRARINAQEGQTNV